MTTPYQEREDHLQQLASRSCEHLLRGEFAMGEKVAREFLELAQHASDGWHSLAQLRLGTILENVGRYQEARSHAEAAQDAVSPANPAWYHATGLIGNIMLNQGDLEAARTRFLSVIDFWPEASFALCSLAAVELNLENIDAGHRYALRALESACKKDDREHMGVANNLIGDAELDLGNPVQAEQHFRTALAVNEEIGRRRGISIACQRLAEIESERKNYAAALEFGQRAVDAETEMGRMSEVTAVCGRVVYGLRKLGLCETECPELLLGAISLCQIAVEAETAPADKVWALQSEAWFNRDLKRFRQAEKLLAQALSYLEESDQETARTHGLIGILKEDQGFFTRAKSSFLRSAELAERHGHDRALRAAFRYLGWAMKIAGDKIQARHYWQRALKLAQNAGDEEAAKDLQHTLKLYRPSLFDWFGSKIPWRRHR